jgi:hypothetical protein
MVNSQPDEPLDSMTSEQDPLGVGGSFAQKGLILGLIVGTAFGAMAGSTLGMTRSQDPEQGRLVLVLCLTLGPAICAALGYGLGHLIEAKRIQPLE